MTGRLPTRDGESAARSSAEAAASAGAPQQNVGISPAPEFGPLEGRLAGFRFIDHDATDWMILAGLPEDFPDGGEGHGPVAGLTFRSGKGEVRVLPRAAIPRRASSEISVAPLGTRVRVRAPEPAALEELLRHAVVWPPA